MKKSDLQKAKRIVKSMVESTAQNRLDMKDELLFHTLLASASENEIIRRLIPTLTESITNTYVDTRENYRDHRKAAMAHQRILEAIEKGDAELAQGMMRNHLETTLKDIKSLKIKNTKRNRS